MEHGPASFSQSREPLESTLVFAPSEDEIKSDFSGRLLVISVISLVIATIGLWRWVEPSHGSALMMVLGRTAFWMGIVVFFGSMVAWLAVSRAAKTATLTKRIVEFYADGIVISAEEGGTASYSFSELSSLSVEPLQMVMEFSDGPVAVPCHAFHDRAQFNSAAAIVQRYLDSRLKSLRAS